MARDTYYQILEIPRRATDDEVKRAFRRLARRFHPDQNPGDFEAEERFKAVLEAYRVLSDPGLRRTYDRFGVVPAGAAFAESQLAVPSVGATVKGFARAAARLLRARRGADIRMKVTLEFTQAVRGTARVFELPRRGSGGAVRPRRLEFDLPPGLTHGQVLKWPGEGTPGTEGGRAGDLLVVVEVRPHGYLRRNGADIVADLPLSILEMHDGATVDVPTLAGRRRLVVPPGTQPGDSLRLPGLGVPVEPAGDAVFVARLRFPDLDRAELRAALAAAYGTDGTRSAGFDACLLESMAWDG